jgi:predicted Zn-dependent protease
MSGSRLFLLIMAAMLAAVLAMIGWLAVGSWQVRGGIAWARQRMQAGEYAAARDRLSRLSAWCPRDGELEYLLGVCEAELKHPDAAIAAWARIPGGSQARVAAALARGRVLVRGLGQLTDAEAAFRDAARGTESVTIQARWALAELLLWEGRLDEVRRVLQDISRVAPDDRAAALRELWRLDSVVVPAEELGPVLEQAARRAPDDDRAWLARADLSLRYGRYAEARSWLDRCLLKSPDDPVVWRAVLQWAIASGNVVEARRALPRVPANRLTAPEQWSLCAELAAQRKDPDAERRALEHLMAAEPGNTRALDRLAVLAIESGDADRAAALRRRQEEALRDKDRYRRLLIEDRTPVPRDELHERARLAERLGRWFEAQGWLTAAQERDAGDALTRAALERLVREGHRAEPVPAPGLSLLEILGESGQAAPTATALTPAAASDKPVAPGRAALAFRDDAVAAGLRFTYDNGAAPQHPILETVGGGVAVLDYDGDGWLDVYVVQGGPCPGVPISNPALTPDRSRNRNPNPNPNFTADRNPDFPPVSSAAGTPRLLVSADNDDAEAKLGDRLYRNRGDGTFEEVTERAGITRFRRGYGMGVAVADYDNDGRPDLFVTRFGAYQLLHNEGDGTFADVTERAGLGGPRDWPTSAAFADFDADGDLDLFVCHYLEWDVEHPVLCRNPEVPGRYVACLPLGFAARSDHLFRNDGGRFVDVTGQAGIVDRDGRGLGVVAADLDDDGRIDIFVANDMTANRLYRNQGCLKFEEVGHVAGVACNADGGYQAGMGIACGDLDGDGRLDLAVTNFFGESTTFFRNLGNELFADATAAVGLKAPSRFLLGFGIAFLDVNNDGCLDLATANGHIHDLAPKVPFAMPAQLLVGDSRGHLTAVSESAGAPWGVPRIGRGLAAADLDNDGRVDLLLVAQNSPLAYFHNRTEPGGHFLTVRLEGTASNREVIGARVVIIADGRKQTAWRFGGGSYASSGDPRLHFGLGSAQAADEVEVRWPSGRTAHFSKLATDTGYLIREGETRALPLAGFAGGK